jgi:hypothetical protein
MGSIYYTKRVFIYTFNFRTFRLRAITLGTFSNGEYLLYQKSIFIYTFAAVHYKGLILHLKY